MTTARYPVLETVNAATLVPIVQRALNRETAELTQWTAEPLQSNRGGGLGGTMFYRFSGSVQAQGEDIRWSLILKVIPESGVDASWRREVDFYRSELAQNLPGLRAAFCYAIQEHTDTTGRMVVWLWLEEVGGEKDASWSLEDYNQAARHLGQFNGVFLVDRPLPALPWLRQNGPRRYIEAAEPWVIRLQELRNHPLVSPAYPLPEIESYLHLWQCRKLYLTTLDRLPQTLCHQDAQRSNLFLQADAAGHAGLVAIDWSTLGIGSIGLDINQMIGFALFAMDVDVAQAALLDQALYTGYVDGLRDAGWRGDPALARLGYTTAAVRSRTMGVYRYLQFTLDEVRLQQGKQFWQARGHTLDEASKHFHQVDIFFSDLIREAGELRTNLL